MEEINPKFDLKSKLESMVKRSEEIIEEYNRDEHQGEPPIHICLAYDVYNYLPNIIEQMKEIPINGNKDDISAMLVCAVRYALGRRTYIVDWVCEFIRNNTDLLTEKDKAVIIRDIEQQKDYGYGDECDKECWLALLDYLKEGE